MSVRAWIAAHPDEALAIVADAVAAYDRCHRVERGRRTRASAPCCSCPAAHLGRECVGALARAFVAPPLPMRARGYAASVAEWRRFNER